MGRPHIGRKVEVRLDDATLAAVDRIAAAEGSTRAEVLRRLIVRGVK